MRIDCTLTNWIEGPPPVRDDGGLAIIRLMPAVEVDGQDHFGLPIIVSRWISNLKNTGSAHRLNYDDVFLHIDIAAPCMITDAESTLTDDLVLTGLTYAQLAFLRTVNHSRREVADYLRAGVEVTVVPNNEVSEAPPFALDVVSNPGFWIGCFDTPAEAIDTAVKIGLRVR